MLKPVGLPEAWDFEENPVCEGVCVGVQTIHSAKKDKDFVVMIAEGEKAGQKFLFSVWKSGMLNNFFAMVQPKQKFQITFNPKNASNHLNH